MSYPFYGQTQMAREEGPGVKSRFLLASQAGLIYLTIETHDKNIFTRLIREFIEEFTHDRI